MSAPRDGFGRLFASHAGTPESPDAVVIHEAAPRVLVSVQWVERAMNHPTDWVWIELGEPTDDPTVPSAFGRRMRLHVRGLPGGVTTHAVYDLIRAVGAPGPPPPAGAMTYRTTSPRAFEARWAG